MEETIDSTCSSKQIQRELCHGKQVTTGLHNRQARCVVTLRCDIIKEATKFNEELYSKPKEEEKVDAGRAERKNKSRVIHDIQNNEIFPQMLKHEVEITLKNLKTGKGSGQMGLQNFYQSRELNVTPFLYMLTL